MGEFMGVKGNFQRIIKLDAPVEAVYGYFTDFNFVLPRLPEVSRVLRYKDGRYRMIFMTDDGRGHEMGVVFDVRHEAEENHRVKMLPIPLTFEELKNDNHIGDGAFFPGTFTGEATFHDKKHYCEIVYRVTLNIEVEVPRFLNFIPQTMLQKMGEGLMGMKLNAVGEGMSRNVPQDFDEWIDKNQHRFTHLFNQVKVGTNGAISSSGVKTISSNKKGFELN